ncbi:MAG: hypothetical protein ABI310_08040 [Microbacteriaceae bacterium]
MIGTMLGGWVAVSTRWAAATSTPTPAPKVPNADLVTPGVWGFLVIFLIAIVTILLVLDMTRRIRRTRYREEIAAKLDAEETLAGLEADEAERGQSPEQKRLGED